MGSALFSAFDANMRREYMTSLVKAKVKAANPPSLTLFGEMRQRYTPPADAQLGRAPFPVMALVAVVV
jgi:hypothetical protein